MITIERRTRKSHNNFYVYYDESTGEIKSVGTNILESNHYPFVITDSDDARRIVAGTHNDNLFIVDVFAEEPEFVSKEAFFAANKKYALKEIGSKEMSNWDFRIKNYTVNQVFVFELSLNVISRLSAIDAESNAQNFDIYLTKRTNPDLLIDKMQIDISSLLEGQSLVINSKELLSGYALKDLVLLTNIPFKNCYLETVDAEYLGYLEAASFNERLWQEATSHKKGHIEIIQQNREVIIAAQSTSQLYDLNLGNADLLLHLSYRTPDCYLGTIELGLGELLQGKIKKYSFGYDLDDLVILYQMPRLTIRKRKLDDISPCK